MNKKIIYWDKNAPNKEDGGRGDWVEEDLTNKQ